MDRIGSLGRLNAPKGWDHEYKGGPVFKGLPFDATGSDLYHAAATLFKLSGQENPLIWGKRLAHRYVETRDSRVGISSYVYSLPNNTPKLLLAKDSKEFRVYDANIFNDLGWGDPSIRRHRLHAFTFSAGVVGNIELIPCICQLSLAEMLGDSGKEFKQWALEELSARGKNAYRKEDNAWIPMLMDGTRLEGYVLEKGTAFPPKGTVFKAWKVDLTDFWAYALAYKVTGDKFMWQMARNIGHGNGFGDIGTESQKDTQLSFGTDCSNAHALLGFLALYEKTRKMPFLKMAQRISDNILAKRFHHGFFVPSEKHVYARLNAIESLVLLHLYATLTPDHPSPPTVWPGRARFEASYRSKGEASDSALIYTLTESAEPLISLNEAAAMGNVDLVRSLIAKGADVDNRERGDGSFKTPLHCAVMNGHKDIVELLLADGADINAKGGWRGETSLHYAAEKGHKEVAELLIAKGANVNATDGAGGTPLHSAARTGHKDIVELLIEKSADVNAKNSQGQAPIDIASGHNREDIVKLLVDKGAEISIHMAVQVGAQDQVKAFLDRGIDINVKDKQGSTALFYAVRGKHKDIVELLIAKGADINVRDKRGYTPLYYAIRSKDVNTVKTLVTKGADVNLTAEKDYPPIYYAVRNKNLDIVKLLVAKGAKFDVKVLDDRTVFHHAVSQGSKDIVEFFVSEGIDIPRLYLSACMGDLVGIKDLVEQGADINSKDELGWTPLYWAVSMGRQEMTEFLISKGALVDIRTKNGRTPLRQAVQAGTVKLVKLLISKGAVVKAKDKQGNTPLHRALAAGHHEIVELLIAKGADVNAKTRVNWTPLHQAAIGGHKDVVEILIAHGADVTVKDRWGRTPLDWAKVRKHIEIVEVLTEAAKEQTTVEKKPSSESPDMAATRHDK